MTDDFKDQEKRFNELLPQIKIVINKRRGSWTLSTIPWEDVESILLNKIWRNIQMYDPNRPFDNWANTVISREISNLLRDNLIKWSKPCVSAGPYGGHCAFNDGGDKCRYTKSGKQCKECPLYHRWERKKQAQYNINSSLPLEHHDMEVQNIQEDFLDYEAAKLIIDKKMLAQLNKHDAKVYRLLYIEHLSMEEVSKRMKYKTQSNSRVGQVLRRLITRFKKMAADIVESEDLA